MSRDDWRTKQNKEELVARIARHCPSDGPKEAAEGLQFYRCSKPTQPLHTLFSPAVCIVAQGAKEVLLGEDRFRYNPANCFIGSLDVPIVSQVVEATIKKPYLSLKLDLVPSMIASVSVEIGAAAGRPESNVKSMAVSELQADLLDAFVRLVSLLDSPADYPVVSQLVTREIIYRLLTSDQGPRLRQMAVPGGHAHRIANAVKILRSRFDEQLRMEDLANELGMSISSFHQHFKTTTSMSPLQFQKLLRLQEARRLLLSEDLDASSAAGRVGYDDASQFSREYKRLFGEPPKRDIERFRQLAATARA